jgi:glycosyltransferase involved in cell wall biosynthesis
MRIAIYENLPPGGAKRVSFEFGRQLARRHEIDLYRLSITDNRAFDLAPFARQVFSYAFAPLFGRLDGRLKGGHFAPRSYTLFAPLKRLHRRIAGDLRRRGYDVVLAHTDAMTQSPYLLRWLEGVPSVYYCHEVLRIRDELAAQEIHNRRLAESPFPIGRLRLLEDSLVRRRLIIADAASTAAAGTIGVNSKYTRERVKAIYGRDAVVCYPGVDADHFRPDPAVSRHREVLSIGSPPSYKGHDLVIEALSRIDPGRRPALRIIMAGRADTASLEQLARARGVRLSIDVGLDESALAGRYRAALATVCAARLEPLGLTPLESMACETPVIAIDEAGYRETVVQGVTGLLVEPSPVALGDAVASLTGDPGRATTLGQAGRARVTERWSWEDAGRRLESLLERLSTRTTMATPAAERED